MNWCGCPRLSAADHWRERPTGAIREKLEPFVNFDVKRLAGRLAPWTAFTRGTKPANLPCLFGAPSGPYTLVDVG